MILQKLSPILWTKDLDATITFYISYLGFTSHSSFSNFVSLYRDTIELMFIVPQDEPANGKNFNSTEEFFPKPHLTGSIFILADEVDELWNSIKEKVNVKTALANREYLMRDFSILDNNGYEIVFGKDISNTK